MEQRNYKPSLQADKNKESIQFWEENANAWIELTSQGGDLYRDHVATPGFFSVLPPIKNLKGLDVGCGDGFHTRLLAKEGGKMTAVDLCKKFLSYANEKEQNEKLGIEFLNADALNLPFKDQSFDFVTSFFSLIDIPDYTKALYEMYRVLKVGGFLQFLIPHPCTWTPDFEWVYKDEKKVAGLCKDYFISNKGEVKEWTFEGLNYQTLKEQKKTFQSLQYRRTLSEWINTLIKAEFVIEMLEEPQYQRTDLYCPVLEGANILPIFLVIRVRK